MLLKFSNLHPTLKAQLLCALCIWLTQEPFAILPYVMKLFYKHRYKLRVSVFLWRVFYLQVPAANPIGALAFGCSLETGTEFYLYLVIDRYSISFLKQEFCTFASNCFILKWDFSFAKTTKFLSWLFFFYVSQSSILLFSYWAFLRLKFLLLVWYYLTPDSKLRT
jgi:hypothetical protein